MSTVNPIARRAKLKVRAATARAESDPGPANPPFRDLVVDYPSTDVYPAKDFRTEWGPIFHRGRLDGSARLLVIGQDPASHEDVVRRILVGEAGQRVQGFMARLGITRSYVMINTFLYSVGPGADANKYKTNAPIAEYRNRWFDAIVSTSQIEGVVALGSLAEAAWQQYKKTTSGKTHAKLPFARIMHPTADSHAGVTTAQLLATWNAGLATLRPAIQTPDAPAVAANYGDAFTPADLVQIPDVDYPPGLPSWMHNLDGWAARGVPANVPADHRRVLTIIIPEGATS